MHLHKETGRIALIGSPPAFFVTSLQFPQQKQQIRTHDQSAQGSDYIVLVDLKRLELSTSRISRSVMVLLSPLKLYVSVMWSS